jgi:Fe-S-cluster containining protein
LPKDADGYCNHLNRENYLCGIWDVRSRTCRGYSCNGDFLLQVAVRNPFKNIAELVKMATTAYIPKETYISIPPAEEA